MLARLLLAAGVAGVVQNPLGIRIKDRQETYGRNYPVKFKPVALDGQAPTNSHLGRQTWPTTGKELEEEDIHIACRKLSQDLQR